MSELRCVHDVTYTQRCLQCDVDIGARVIQLVCQELKSRPIGDLFDGRIFETEEWPKQRKEQ